MAIRLTLLAFLFVALPTLCGSAILLQPPPEYYILTIAGGGGVGDGPALQAGVLNPPPISDNMGEVVIEGTLKDGRRFKGRAEVRIK